LHKAVSGYTLQEVINMSMIHNMRTRLRERAALNEALSDPRTRAELAAVSARQGRNLYRPQRLI
jgi:hypothetical protein